MPFSPQVLAARDGTVGIHVRRCLGEEPVPGRSATKFVFEALFQPKGKLIRVGVLFGSMFRRGLEPGWFAINGTEEDALRALALCRIGDWLDEEKAHVIGDSSYSLEALDGYLHSVRERPSSEDQTVLRYMVAKSWWEYRYGSRTVEFGSVDRLRLRVEEQDFQRVGDVHPNYWTSISATGAMYKCTPHLIQQCQQGSLPGLASSPIHQVQSHLEASRYDGPRSHFEKATNFILREPRDLPNGVKEALASLESMGRVLTGLENAPFGRLIADLKRDRNLDPTLAAALGNIWGYGNQQPGARHAGASPPRVNAIEAAFVLNVVAAGLLMLKDMDDLKPSTR